MIDLVAVQLDAVYTVLDKSVASIVNQPHGMQEVVDHDDRANQEHDERQDDRRDEQPYVFELYVADLVDLLADSETRDSVLDSPRLVEAILCNDSQLRISSQFYFYVLARYVLRDAGIRVETTSVGDRYVLEALDAGPDDSAAAPTAADEQAANDPAAAARASDEPAP